MKQPERTESTPALVEAKPRILHEPGFWLLLILTAAIFCTRPAILSLRGEETRRGMIAREMLDTGNWLIPTQQGVPRFTKPPLHYWLVAAVGYVRGEVDSIAIRLPSIVAILLTAIVLYAYARQFGSTVFAFGSAAAFISMAQVVQIGRLGEMEAVFTLLVCSSLLAWHWAFEKRQAPMLAWTVGYVLCALGALAKGPQAPVYFVGGTAVYLTLSGRFRALLSTAHATGILLATAVAGAWVIPYVHEMGWTALNRIFVGEAAIRVNNPGMGEYLSHLVEFPLELAGCMLPWSLLLFAFLNKPLRNGLQNKAASIRFCVICIAIALPTVWLPAGGRTRYLMPIYPLVAILIGAVVEQISMAADGDALAKFWRNCMAIFATGCLVAGVAAGAAYGLNVAPGIVPSLAKTTSFALIAVTVGGYLIYTVRQNCPARVAAPFAVMSAFCGLIVAGPLQDVMILQSTDEPAHIARLRDDLELHTPLWSLGQVHHFFAYHYEQPIAVVEREVSPRQIAVGDYFCFDRNHVPTPLPFSWEKITEVSCDRKQLRKPLVAVIVGRRTSDVVAEQPHSDSLKQETTRR